MVDDPPSETRAFGEGRGTDRYRYTCFLTDQNSNDLALLELRYRGRARE
jgi:hypothetical protein